MENLKKCLSLLIVFSFLLQPLPGHSIEATEEIEGETLPQNPPGTPEDVMCVSQNIVPPPGRPCCVGLQPNAEDKCDEVPASSPEIVSCTSNSDCSNGMGCFSQTISALQSGASFKNLPGAEEASSVFLDALSTSLEEGDGTKYAGAACVHSRECISYSCSNTGICEDKKSCRYALSGEAVAGVDCARGLVKGPDGKCGPSPEEANPTYVALADPNNIEMNQQCQMTLDPNLKKSFILSMKAMRAMEVFLSNITIAPRQEECFDVIPYLKELTREYVSNRKNLLYFFTKNFNDLEKDFETLTNAKSEGPDADKIVTIHGGEQILNKDLATRLTSGYDSLMIMYRRNLLFKEYEEAMKDLTAKYSINFMKMEAVLAGYNNSGFPQGFSFGSKPETVPTWQCRASMYKKRSWWTWRDRFYMDVKDRWSVYYEVIGSNGGVSSVVNNDFVATTLGLIHNVPKEDAVRKYTASKYYLMNPMIYWGKPTSFYGPAKRLQYRIGFLGFSGRKDLRKAYFINNFSSMLEDSRPVTINHFTKLRDTEFFQREPLTNFLSEPDLVTTAAKDCLHNPRDPSKCTDFSAFMKEVQDEAFAHFLSFGYSSRADYSNYFSSAESGRRKYYAKIMTDTRSLDGYYDKVINARIEQNKCLDRLMNGIEDSGILAGGPGGLTEGGVYYVPGKPTGNGLNPTSSRTNVTNDQLRALRRQGFNFRNSNSSLTSSTTSNLDNVVASASNAAGSSLSDSDKAFLASRRGAMSKANEKAKKAGVDVSSQAKAVKDLSDEIMSKSVTGRGAGFGAGLASGGASSGSGLGAAGQANVSATNSDRSTGPTGEGVGGVATVNLNSAGAQSGANAGANSLSGIAAGSNSGYGHGSGVNAGSGSGEGKDGTGLSDMDKERLMSEYERNKKDYLGSEEDGLFSKVSKAYVRNLEKVLIKKKKIEP